MPYEFPRIVEAMISRIFLGVARLPRQDREFTTGFTTASRSPYGAKQMLFALGLKIDTNPNRLFRTCFGARPPRLRRPLASSMNSSAEQWLMVPTPTEPQYS